jgi:hypothetical protein
MAEEDIDRNIEGSLKLDEITARYNGVDFGFGAPSPEWFAISVSLSVTPGSKYRLAVDF